MALLTHYVGIPVDKLDDMAYTCKEVDDTAISYQINKI